MKRICIVGKDPRKISGLREKLREFNLIFSYKNPELVIAYGGDGTFLVAERQFPGVPKVLIKGSKTGKKAVNVDVGKVIEKFLKVEYKLEHLKKLKATSRGRYGGGELEGVNDIVIRNTLPTEAIRFRLKINGKKVDNGREFIGDGLVVATPYGSGAYFYSVSRETFDKGIGIAFSNVTKHHEFVHVKNDAKIEVEITRGPAVLVADNNRNLISLQDGDKVFIIETKEVAKRVVLD